MKSISQWIVAALTPILCAVAIPLAVIALGRGARAALHDKISPNSSVITETWPQRSRNDLAPTRSVDGMGIALPVVALRSHLPVLTVDTVAADGPLGTRWSDRRVRAAAVAYLRPHLSRLRLDDCYVEIVEGEVIFRKPGVRVVWGHPPGQEGPGEAPAKVKLQRLLDYHDGHDGLQSLEHDVRLLAYQGHFPLMHSDRP